MVTLTGLGGRGDVPHPTRPPGALGGGSSLFFKLGKALTIKKNSFLFSVCVSRLLDIRHWEITCLHAYPAVDLLGGHNLASS